MATEIRDVPIYLPTDFELNQAVDIHAQGSWYQGVIVKIGPSRVTVRYTSGTGRTRDKAVNPSVKDTWRTRGNADPVRGAGVQPIGVVRAVKKVGES